MSVAKVVEADGVDRTESVSAVPGVQMPISCSSNRNRSLSEENDGNGGQIRDKFSKIKI